MELQKYIDQIKSPNAEAMKKARKHWDSIGKPLGSLGKLEEALIQIAGIQGDEKISVKNKALIIMCADNGVVEEKVSQTGQEVTAIVAENFLDEKSCVAIMCAKAAAKICPIDIGMAVDTPRVEKRKIAYGTGNIAKGPAMSREQAISAIMVGLDKVRELKEEGIELIATGEMGIGNTTTSSAITSVLLNVPVEDVTGRGAGLSTEGLNRKISVIKKAIKINGFKDSDASDPINILAVLGGFDIAGLVGVFIGGAIYRIPIVIDGFISAVAALLAYKIAPECIDFILPSHVSKEPASKLVLDALNKEAFLTCDMHLGEGSGAVALFPLLDFASDIYHKMGTFEDINVKAYKHLK